MKKKAIRITSQQGTEFDTEIGIGNEKYLVQTENFKGEKPLIITRVYLNGQILSTKKTDYSNIIGTPDVEKRIQQMMQKQHRQAVSTLTGQKSSGAKTTSDYLEEAKELLKSKNKKNALMVLLEGLEHYPDDPFLLSYHGCLEAVVNKNYDKGISICNEAIAGLKKRVPFGEDFFFPAFYLNLGRAHVAAGNRKQAIDAFRKGLAIDAENSDLQWEIRKLGVRRNPPISFLERSNPLNKYIGKILHTVKK